MCRFIAVTQARDVPHIVNQLKIRTCRFLATAIPHIIELWKDLSGRSVAKAIYSKHHLTVERWKAENVDFLLELFHTSLKTLMLA